MTQPSRILAPLAVFTVTVIAAACAAPSRSNISSVVGAASTSPLGHVDAIAAAGSHTCARIGDHAVCWGSNTFGESGLEGVDGSRGAFSREGAVPVARFPGELLTMAAGPTNTCALVHGDPAHSGTELDLPDDDQAHPVDPYFSQVDLYCWGSTNGPVWSALMAGPEPLTGAPESLPLDGLFRTVADPDLRPRIESAVATLALDERGLCFATTLGKVECWTGIVKENPAPLQKQGVHLLARGTSHACASNGTTLWCWGSNGRGELGGGETLGAGPGQSRPSSDPVVVTGLTAPITAITAGAGFTCAATGAGVVCFGADGFGQLGDASVANGTVVDQNHPVLVAGLPANTAITSLSSGPYHTCAVAGDDV
jgi:hypothetical protein